MFQPQFISENKVLFYTVPGNFQNERYLNRNKGTFGPIVTEHNIEVAII